MAGRRIGSGVNRRPQRQADASRMSAAVMEVTNVIRKIRRCLAAGIFLAGTLTACGTADKAVKADIADIAWSTEPVEETKAETAGHADTALLNGMENNAEKVYFVDTHGQEYQFEIDPAVKRHGYDLKFFVHDGERLSYAGDDNFTFRLGLDICHYHGTIDWEKVRADGFEFAFVRLGCRGYGEEGRIRLDREFVNNIENAQTAGLDVGVYFFSQAVNEEEAAEEAGFVLESLEGYELQLPVVFDPEHIEIEGEKARTDDVTGEQFTKNAEVFCRMIEEAGFQPMIYCNLLWQAFELDLEKLAQYPIWYADYEPMPQTPYQFEFWQYTNTATVEGITGPVDLDIQLIRKDK